jgi:hypothetical protein
MRLVSTSVTRATTWVSASPARQHSGKAFGALVLILAVSTLLFFLVFPEIEPLLPFTDVAVTH